MKHKKTLTLSKLAALFSILVLLAMPLTPVAAQQPPSQVRVDLPGKPAASTLNATFLDSLLTFADGIVRNVSERNFTSAAGELLNYHGATSPLSEHPAGNASVLDAIVFLRLAFDQFVPVSKQFDELSQRQSLLVASDPHGAESINNTRTMKGLGNQLVSVNYTLKTYLPVIYDAAVQQGLETSPYDNTTNVFNAYIAELQSRLSNVTAAVAQNTTTSLAVSPSAGQYGDAIRFTGVVQANETGVANSSVNIVMDNDIVATVTGNETGAYSYAYTIDKVAVGNHVVQARYDPRDDPLYPSSSAHSNFTVQESPATIAMQVDQGSLVFQNKIVFQGVATSATGPVANAPVVLYVDQSPQIITQTNETGAYKVVYSMGLADFIVSLFQPQVRHAYALLEPAGRPLTSAQSTALSMPTTGTQLVAALHSGPGLLTAVILVTLVVGGGRLVYTRRQTARRAASPEALSQEALTRAAAPYRPPLLVTKPLQATAPSEPRLTEDVDNVVERARSLFGSGSRQAALVRLYNSAVRLSEQQGQMILPSSMTHREKSRAIERALPAVAIPLGVLTYLYELASYSGEPVTEDDFDEAVRAFAETQASLKRSEGSG